jgi:hypothetical protein
LDLTLLFSFAAERHLLCLFLAIQDKGSHNMFLMQMDELKCQSKMGTKKCRKQDYVPAKRYLLASVCFEATEVKKVGKRSLFLVVGKTSSYETLIEGTSLVGKIKAPNRVGNERVGRR